MTNAHRILLYASLLCVTLILGGSLLRKLRLSSYHKKCFFYLVFLSGWMVTDLFSSAARSPLAVRYLYDLRIAWIACLVLIVCAIVIGFYGLGSRLPSRLIGASCVIPAVTVLLALTSPLHPLLTRDFQIYSLSPLTMAGGVRGFWYHLSIGYYISLIVCVFLLVLSKYAGLRRAYRGGTGLLITSLLLIGGFGLLELARPSAVAFDLVMLGFVCSGFSLWLSTALYDRPNHQLMERTEVFHRLEKGICILDTGGRILDINTVAQTILGLRRSNIDCVFEEHLNALCRQGKMVRRTLDNQLGEDLIVRNGRFPVMYQLRSYPLDIFDSPSTSRYIVLTDVTSWRLFAERLQSLSGVDFLTGLPNSIQYRELLRSLDRADNLPVSCIVCAVEELKEINEKHGRYEGDLTLKSAADAIGKACPENSRIARVSGSMFVVMLPRCDRNNAEAIAEAIRSGLTAASVAPRMVLRPVTKTKPDENLGLLLADAGGNITFMPHYDAIQGKGSCGN